MPNRILKENICSSESIDAMSWFEESFFYRLIVNCDDYGRMDARPAIIKARLFPLKDRVTIKNISDALSHLALIGCVKLYDCDSKPYLYLPSWGLHQSIRAAKSKYPDPSDGIEHDSICNQLHADEINCMQMHADEINCNQMSPYSYSYSESNSYSETRARSSTRKFTPPSLQDVIDYVASRNSVVDAQRFWDYFDTSGWVDSLGRPVRNWKQKVITWEGKDKDRLPPSDNRNSVDKDYTSEPDFASQMGDDFYASIQP